LAKVNWEGGEICLDIYGIIEIKSYNPSAKRIKNQLKRHMERLRDHEMKVMVIDTGEGEMRWNSWNTMFEEANTRKINVSLISWKEPLLNIIVQPFRLSHPVVKGEEEDILTLLLPWKRPGFRGMGVGFTGWLIQNIARTLKPDDYYLGWEIWSFILERLIGRSTLSRRDRLIIEELYHFLRGIKPNPDYYWEF